LFSPKAKRKAECLYSEGGYQAFLLESPQGSGDGFVFVTSPEPFSASTIVHRGKIHALRLFFDPMSWIKWAKANFASAMMNWRKAKGF